MQRCLKRFNSLHLAGFCQFSNKIYGIASRIGGASSDNLYEKYAGKFVNQDLEMIKRIAYKSTQQRAAKKEILPGVNIITTKEECQRCVDILMKSNSIAAWDTQTMDLDIKQQAPVGKGKIICATFFAGPELDFGRGPRVFIDNFGNNAGLINYFKPYLQSDKHLKIWHNYGFDRHLFYNHGIDVRGFGGDTMHMARLLDPSKMFGQYTLAALTKQNKDYIKKLSKEKIKYDYLQIMKELSTEKNSERQKEMNQVLDNMKLYVDYYSQFFTVEKKKMQLIFGRRRMLKSGGEGATYEYPNTLTLHTSKQYLQKWIQYCVLDSQATFYLKKCLEQKLQSKKTIEGKRSEDEQKLPRTVWEIYEKYWRPFGQLLTDIQRAGIRVDLQYMQKIRDEAIHDLKKKEDYFLNFLTTFQEDKNIDHFNPSSPLQLQQLLFAPCQLRLEEAKKLKQKEKKKEQQKMNEQDRKLMIQQEQSEKAQDAYQDNPIKKGIRKAVSLNELYKTFKIQNKYGSKPKFIEMKVKGLQIPFEVSTPTGLPSVEEAVLQQLAGDPENEKYGTAFDFFNKKGNPQFGQQLCLALKVLVDYSSIETLLKTFIQPLISYIDHTGRVHCSLNINTQTGRLSARKPNLQNQPALDKDIYKIRKAFVASKGKKFIVADYGQLQLRVLAHLTNCQAMITAFKEGGDFHSRTAIGMYSYIKKEIDQGTVLLEWDKAKGKPPVPLLKDKYASQRKKAKTVNFSIAYGKTAQGFANDWGCTLQEANKVIQAWFDSRKQVRQWQAHKKYIARTKKKTQTLLGRQRSLSKFYSSESPNNSLKGMGDRRAINTPIQGGAADIVIASMVKIVKNQRLKDLGWKLLMQIHDELILQGPQQSAEQALALVKYDMSHPFEFDLRVQLQVDAKIGDNWYECK